MRFIHTADLHLDSPLLGLSAYEGAPIDEIRGATRHALSKLIDLAIAQSVDFVVIAGDLYDGDWKDYNTGLFFAHQMSRLREHGIPVFAIAGNHDAANKMTRTLDMPDNVRLLDTKRPETVMVDGLDVAIHGQGFANAVVTDNLARNYPDSVPGCFNIGLLHTSADGSEDHATYAPCSVNDLLAKRYDYWALGHIHKREVLNERPWIVFAGNLQGRHIKEEAVEGKGCTLVQVDDGQITDVVHHPLDTVRWQRVFVDASGALYDHEIAERIGSALAQCLQAADGRILAARIVLQGTTPLHGEIQARHEWWLNQCRLMATDLAPARIWIEKLKLSTTDPATTSEAGAFEALEDFRDAFAQLGTDAAFVQAVAEDLRPFFKAYRAAGTASTWIGNIADDETALRQRCHDLTAAILAKLEGKGGAESD